MTHVIMSEVPGERMLCEQTRNEMALDEPRVFDNFFCD